MRVPKSWVPSIAKRIAGNLVDKGLIETPASARDLITETERLLLDELMVEERLNEEVRQLLKKHELDIAKGGLDYRKLFDMTKRKIVKEKDIIL
ncbi:DUF507 family protein [Thermodesulfovibrionales bacterium]|nr:DUF507 family protein [Thermodesulfovibrionales bacterium]MCL0051113.1 DUF507 family protein [Thermodesulfovibrionales bacterium]MCL0082933.1 DUF507 family protein [Thermodesulfovibrionales bacterium]